MPRLRACRGRIAEADGLDGARGKHETPPRRAAAGAIRTDRGDPVPRGVPAVRHPDRAVVAGAPRERPDPLRARGRSVDFDRVPVPSQRGGGAVPVRRRDLPSPADQPALLPSLEGAALAALLDHPAGGAGLRRRVVPAEAVDVAADGAATTRLPDRRDADLGQHGHVGLGLLCRRHPLGLARRPAGDQAEPRPVRRRREPASLVVVDGRRVGDRLDPVRLPVGRVGPGGAELAGFAALLDRQRRDVQHPRAGEARCCTAPRRRGSRPSWRATRHR